MNTLSKFVIFQNGFIESCEDIDENLVWLNLYKVFKNKNYKEANLEDIETNYKELFNKDHFWDIQFKFFLVRQNQGKFSKDSLEELYSYWHENLPLNIKQLGFNLLTSFDKNQMSKYGKYYYPIPFISKYLKEWNDNQMTLSTWKKFKYILISKEIPLLKLLKPDNYKLKRSHVRSLFDEYVNEVFNSEMEPRIEQSLLKKKETAILDRAFTNIASKEDNSYLNKTFNLNGSKSLSETLSRCLTTNIEITEIDIHSPQCLANYFALIKYYEELLKPLPKKNKTKAMYFKNMPTDKAKKDKVYEALKDIYDHIKSNCPKSSWLDFKSIFTKNGTSSKIIWTGDKQVLQFIFAKLDPTIKFTPNKWEAVCHYFHPSKEDNFEPKKIQSNSGYKNEILGKHIQYLITTLT